MAADALNWKDAVRAALNGEPLEVLGEVGRDAGKWWPVSGESPESLVIAIAGNVGRRTYRLAHDVGGTVNAACGVHGLIPCEGAGCICTSGVMASDAPHGSEGRSE